jgi:hypothetical protein
MSPSVATYKSNSAVVMQHAGRRSRDARDGAQILVDCSQIALTHALLVRPGYDLQEIAIERLIVRKAVACDAH